MSKQADAKKQQGWRKTPRTCANCKSFTSKVEQVKSEWSNHFWVKESELRCTVGGFKVGKRNTCDLWDSASLSTPEQPK